MRVLVACEESQAVCIAFREKGHEAFSCDLLPCSGGHPEWHIQYDALRTLTSKEFVTNNDYFFKETHFIDKWDLVIAHPPCTRLSNSGVRWLSERDLWNEMELSSWFFRQFVNYGKRGNKIAIENPIPHKYAVSQIGEKYHQIIQPWQFGHPETKATCLWLYGLPKLQPTNIVEGKEQKIWKMSPGPERAKLRSKTYSGIAHAFADQYSKFIESGMSVKEWEASNII